MKCRWYQFVINRALDDGRDLPPGADGHLLRCARCRDFFEDQRGVINQMHRMAPAGDAPQASPCLRARILNRIQAGPRRAVAPRPGRLSWAGMAVIIGVAVALVLPLLKPGQKVPVAAGNNGGTKTELVSVALLEQSGRLTSGGDWLQAATNIDQPLHREMNLVISDAQNAWRSLREELLPSHLLAKSE
jgi:hypothetical protein